MDRKTKTEVEPRYVVEKDTKESGEQREEARD